LKTLLSERLPRAVFEEVMGGGPSRSLPVDIPGASQQSTRSLPDDDIPEMTQQPLQPTEYVPTPPPRGRTFKQKLARWGNWLLRFVTEPVERPINSAFETFKKRS